MGEEVAEYNGAYKVSQGLLDKFGPKRVIDSPISETGFAGLGIGAAMYGLRPVIEFMTWSFSLVAYDQIVNNAAQVRYMSGGQFSVPIVFRGSSGGGLQVGATHSHTPENWYANVPALTVITPAFPDDAKGLLKSAIRSNNPVCFLENEKLYGYKDEVPEGEHLTPIGKARVVKAGSDFTIVSNSGSVHRALNAMKKLEEQGIHAELIDVRTIKPLDFDTIAASVSKTNRLLIVEENKPFAGWGAQVAYEVQRELFDDLDAPVHRLTSLDVPQPYNGRLEQAVLPNEERILAAVKEAPGLMSGPLLPDGIRVRWLGHSHVRRHRARTGQKFLFDPFLANNPALPQGARRGSARARRFRRAHPHASALRSFRRRPAAAQGRSEAEGHRAVRGRPIGSRTQGIAEDQVVGMNTRRHARPSRTSASPWCRPVHTSSVAEKGVARAARFPIGYVLRFANGFTIYNTGDTAVTMDMQIVRDLYRPNLVILPIGDFFTMGAGAGRLRAQAAPARVRHRRPLAHLGRHAARHARRAGKGNGAVLAPHAN